MLCFVLQKRKRNLFQEEEEEEEEGGGGQLLPRLRKINIYGSDDKTSGAENQMRVPRGEFFNEAQGRLDECR